jgi:hypothetical protein
MKTGIAVFLLIILLHMPSFAAAPLSNTDIALELVYIGVYAIDWGQTLDIACREKDGYYEYNPIIGRYPSRAKVNTVFSLFFVGQIAGTIFLPNQYHLLGYTLNLRRIWQLTFISISGTCVVNNYRIGLHVNF